MKMSKMIKIGSNRYSFSIISLRYNYFKVYYFRRGKLEGVIENGRYQCIQDDQ